MSEHNHTDNIKTVDREVTVFHKRKGEQKSNVRSMTDDDDIDSAPSIKTASNQPLPQLQKDKRKLVIKPFGPTDSKGPTTFVQKEVRQHDNILLKQRNNLLVSENMKMKTKITVLEKQNQRLQKSLENDTSQVKHITSYGVNRERVKPADASIRAIIRGLRKEIEDLKKQNTNIKSAVKFTSLKELELQRDHLAQETIRLRLALEEETARRTSLKVNVHGVTNLEHKLHSYTEKNAALTKQLRQAQQKCKKVDEVTSKVQKAVQNDKRNARSLHAALMQIKQKDAELQQLRSQLKTTNSIPSGSAIQQGPKQNKFQIRRTSVDRKPKGYSSQNKPNSQSKIRSVSGCQKCKKLDAENKQLIEKIKKLESQLQDKGGDYGELPKGEITEVQTAQVEQLIRFMSLRFKAHRLSFEQSQKYLINCEGEMDQAEMSKQISVRQLMQSLFVEPFCVVSNRYIEILIYKLIYPSAVFPLTIEEAKQVKKKEVIENYNKLMPKYEILNQQKEEEMFIQVAELITTYYQQILAALTAKRNGEGTIGQQAFLDFFKEIQLQQEYIDFIITQIILQSLDMNHLNFFAMFQIFYMPQMNTNAPATGGANKKKFQVQHQQIVQQEDEEYEDSKSHMGSRHKTLEGKEKDEKEEANEEYQWQEEESKEKSPQPNKQTKPQTGNQEEEVYEEEFEDKEQVVEDLMN